MREFSKVSNLKNLENQKDHMDEPMLKNCKHLHGHDPHISDKALGQIAVLHKKQPNETAEEPAQKDQQSGVVLLGDTRTAQHSQNACVKTRRVS